MFTRVSFCLRRVSTVPAALRQSDPSFCAIVGPQPSGSNGFFGDTKTNGVSFTEGVFEVAPVFLPRCLPLPRSALLPDFRGGEGAVVGAGVGARARGGVRSAVFGADLEPDLEINTDLDVSASGVATAKVAIGVRVLAGDGGEGAAVDGDW